MKVSGLTDDKPRIIQALSGIPGLARALPAWPDDWAALPCIVVSEAGSRPVDYRDGVARITEVEYCLRVFANRAAEQAEVASVADKVMRELGYERVMIWDDDREGTKHKAMRYKTYF